MMAELRFADRARGSTILADHRHKSDIVNRLKSVEGHLRAVQRMVEQDQYCIDILKQTLAVQGAIDRINSLILERHLKTCVTTAIRAEDQSERERVIGELMQLFQGASHVTWNRCTPAPSLHEVTGSESYQGGGPSLPSSSGTDARRPEGIGIVEKGSVESGCDCFCSSESRAGDRDALESKPAEAATLITHVGPVEGVS